MQINKIEILNNICYTELVYGRINKKLKINFSKKEIQIFIFKILNETKIDYFLKIGKNFYISSYTYEVKITINSNTFRVITADII